MSQHSVEDRAGPARCDDMPEPEVAASASPFGLPRSADPSGSKKRGQRPTAPPWPVRTTGMRWVAGAPWVVGRRRAELRRPGRDLACRPGTEQERQVPGLRRTATLSSTSTGAPDGRLATPTAARAVAPRLAPSQSCNAADAPSATCECPPNAGVQAMKTVILRHRSICASPPTAAAIAARACVAARWAADRASAIDTSTSTVPRTCSSPPIRGVIPALNAVPS
jgi:hypothetical protein